MRSGRRRPPLRRPGPPSSPAQRAVGRRVNRVSAPPRPDAGGLSGAHGRPPRGCDVDAGPRAVALDEGDARGNHPRDEDEVRSAADPGMVLQRPALRAPLHREDLRLHGQPSAVRPCGVDQSVTRRQPSTWSGGCWPSARSTGTRTGRSRIRPRSTPCSRSANFSSAPTHYVNCSLVQSARASNWSSSRELGKSAPAPPCRPHLSS